jgi:hypothetical protein
LLRARRERPRRRRAAQKRHEFPPPHAAPCPKLKPERSLKLPHLRLGKWGLRVRKLGGSPAGRTGPPNRLGSKSYARPIWSHCASPARMLLPSGNIERMHFVILPRTGTASAVPPVEIKLNQRSCSSRFIRVLLILRSPAKILVRFEGSAPSNRATLLRPSFATRSAK